MGKTAAPAAGRRSSARPAVAFFNAAAICLLVAGCTTVGPNYRRPFFELPSVPASPADAAPSHWWRAFHDPVLDELLREATEHNQDLLLAAARVEEARALAKVAGAERGPRVDATLGLIRYPTNDSTVGGVQTRSLGPGDDASSYQFAMMATYEIDFWGKLAHADEAARARLLAQQANRRLVRNELEVHVAQSYVALRALDAQLALAESTRHARAEALRLQEVRVNDGGLSLTELHQSEAALAGADIALARARRAVAATESLLAVLLGRSPAGVSNPSIARGAPITQLHAELRAPAELSSDLLNHRPDITAAEQTLVAANADVSRAKADCFPSLKLGAALGSAGAMVHPSSLVWNLGAGLFQPVFNAGALEGAVHGAEARKAQAMARYAHVVQDAFRDVHDALVDMKTSQQVLAAAQARVAALQEVLRIATAKEARGYSSYQDLLETQQEMFAAQTALVDAQRAQFDATIGLFRAVGISWDAEPALASK
jgi:multidrug efflux system outer membrane protein